MAQNDRHNQQPLLLNESIKQSVAEHSHLNASVHSTEDSIPSNLHFDLNTRSRSQKINCRYKALQVTSAICVIISLLIAFGLPPLINHIIIEQAKSQIIMTPDNEGRWAHFPGQSETVILRNFTFFRFENEGEFIFQHAKPVFRQFSGFKMQQIEDYLDIEYLEGGNLVKVRDWLRFAEWPQSRDLDEEVEILNMASFGYWSRLKTSRPTIFLQQGLAVLFTNLENSIIPNLIGSAINQQYLKNSTQAYSAFFAPAGISTSNSKFMWNDPAYGISSSENLGFWVQAATNCFENRANSFEFSSQGRILKNHFVLTDMQLKSLMAKMYSYVTSLRKLLLENHYCKQIRMQECTGRYLAIAQFSQGWVTSNTPPVSTITPNDTVCDNNITCKGKYPQLYAFANNIFKINESLAKQLNFTPETIKFNRNTVGQWFDYNKSIQQGLQYNTARNCLLHIGNLDHLWQMGTQFEKNFDIKLLQPIRVRFGLQSDGQALVFWEWIRYFAYNFVLQQSPNAFIGIATLFTSGLYEHFSILKDSLQRFLLAKMLNQEISSLNCQHFFESALDQQQNPQLINRLCKTYDITSQDFSSTMIDVCEVKFGSAWTAFKQQGVTLQAMQTFCDMQGTENVGNRIHRYKIYFDQLYNCSATPNPYCSDFELALIQWQNSTVTLNPPPTLDLPNVTSYSLWNKRAKPIEYNYFIEQYFSKQRGRFPKYSLSQLYQMFTFEHLFSSNLILKQLIQQSINPYFFKYIRFTCIFVSLNGLTTTRKVREILFGYEDQFLSKISNAYPPFGGDPSVNPKIAINDLNITKEQASTIMIFHTGKDDYSKVNQYYQINGYRYLVNNFTSFDGNRTSWGWRSPWAVDDYFYGTNGKIFAPNQFEVDNISVLIPNVQRYGSNHFHGQTEQYERYGADTYVVHLTTSLGKVSPETAKYYQTIPNVFNVTSIYGLPIYVSRNHFMGGEKWIERVDIYNQDRSILYKSTSESDNSFILIEPYSGASFQSCLFLQNNYYHQKDQLFDYPIQTMLPTFSVSRSGNLTQAKFHQFYDPLYTALKVKTVSLYAGIGLVIVWIAVFVIVLIKRRKLKQFQIINPQVTISLQQINEEEEKQTNMIEQ